MRHIETILTTKKLVILFKSNNRISIKMFHADHIRSGVKAYLLILWVYQYLSSDKYELHVRLLFLRGYAGDFIYLKSEDEHEYP